MISYKDSDKDSKEGDLEEEITYSPCKLEGWPVHSSICPFIHSPIQIHQHVLGV